MEEYEMRLGWQESEEREGGRLKERGCRGEVEEGCKEGGREKGEGWRDGGREGGGWGLG